MQLTPGTQLGPYKIERALGSGAMGAVYLAYDERLERRVALKALTEASGAEAHERLHREARAIARLNHSNIAAVYDVFEHEHEAFLVMEYVDGEPLTTLVQSQPVPIERALEIGLQLTEALGYAHHAGIVHRDVKPANVMLTRDGKVKLLDLGVARVASSDPGAATRSSNEAVPSRAGTPAYMAPERLGGQPADARTDVYSAGVVLFELLTGARPYLAPDLMTLAVNVASQPTPRVASKRKDVPPALDELIARAMAKDPKTRIPSAAEFHKGLARVRDTRSGRLGAAWRRRVVVSLVTIAGLALAAWLLWPTLRRSLAAIPVPATIAIPPVANESTDQPDLDELGSLLQSVLSRNLAALPDVTIVPGTVPSSNAGARAGVQPIPGASYTVAVRVRRAVSGISVDAALMRKGDARPLWQDRFVGDAVGVVRFATDSLATALERNHAGSQTMTSEIRAKMRVLPTVDREALREYVQGRAMLDTSDLSETDQKAVALFASAIKRDESFAFAHASLSQAYSSLLKHSTGESSWLDRATDAAQQSLAIDPLCDQAYLASALVFRASKKKDNAVREARKAVALTADSDDAHRILGLALTDQDQTDEALAELRTAIDIAPRHWVNHYSLGWSLLVFHKYREAVDPLKIVTDHLSTFQSAYVNLGFAYVQLGQWESAVGILEHSLRLNPTDRSALNNLATAYFWNHQFDKARKSYLEAIKQDTKNPKQFMNLGDAYQALRDPSEALKAYKQCVVLADAKLAAGFDSGIQAIAAKCDAELGNFDRADDRAREAWAKDETNGEVAYKRAVVYALWNNTEKALYWLEEAFNRKYAPVWVRDDPDLRRIAGHPRFQALIAQAGR